VQIHKQVELYAVINNLFDSEYAEALGHPARINGR
jgi:hypothetical protein